VPSAGTPRLPAPLGWLLRARDPSPRTRRLLLLVGLAAFVVAVAFSLRDLDVSASQIRWWPLMVTAVVLVPGSILANAAELKVMARATADRPLPWVEAIRVVVVATAANLLPIPGAALVRIQALRTRGASGAAATGVNIAGAGIWIGAGLLVAAIVLVGFSPVSAAVAGLVGLGACTAAWLVLVRAARPGRTLDAMWRLLVVEPLVAIMHGARLLLVLAALDIDLDLVQALVIGVSAPLSAAAGVFPSGIGLAEALSGLLAPLVALPAASGVLATALNRVVGLAVTAPIAGVLAVTSPSDEATEDQPRTSR
jgi:hypothetical protein